MAIIRNRGWRNNINIVNQSVGPKQRKDILDDIADKGTFLPRSVLEEDMDQSFLDYVKDSDGLEITLDGKKVPVIFLTLQRWNEFSKTWQVSDKFKNIELPFITVVRNPDIQQGTNQAGLWNIPGRETYTYMRVPTNDGVRKGLDNYKIPQPTSIDITYEVRLFSNRMKDLNKFNRKIQKSFQSRQHYIDVKGHPMPLYLENIGDESNIDDYEKRRFYVQSFEIKLSGYILDDEDFEVIPTINRTMLVAEILEDNTSNNSVTFDPFIDGDKVTYTFIFKPGSERTFTFKSQYDLNFTKLSYVNNISRVVIKINGVGVFDGLVVTTPIVINNNDIITIKVYKDFNTTGKFQLIGNA